MNLKTAFLLFTITLIFLSCNQSKTEVNSIPKSVETDTFIKNVDSKTFKNLIDSGQGIVLDVRTLGEVSQGHIPNATVADIYQRDFVEKINQLPKDKEVYVYCTVGARSSQAAQVLINNGFKKVYNLNGGIIDWTRNAYPLEK
ncbi:rhodanese-like domain-containing protein [Cyclobacteriaceae bacterium YHN15]|jgi:rhodanese-related sulfurtransferase|nr:rhodanese-like domain-containing protein [Cyclobacteriaceae bacterium YHN15]